MKLKPLVWRDSLYGSSSHAFVGGARVASVSYTMTRNDPKPWKLEVNAFCLLLKLQFRTREEAIQRAPEAVLKMLSEVLEAELAETATV